MADEGVIGEADLLAPFRLKKCVTCGYDLRGRADAANCPECGLDISDALVVPPIDKGASKAGCIAMAVFFLLIALSAFGWSNFAASFGYVLLAVIVVILAWRSRPQHVLGPWNLFITTTTIVRNERRSPRVRAMRDLAPPQVRCEAQAPSLGRGQPVFRWILEYGNLAGDLSTHFRATEEQANALRDEVVRRMEAVGDDQPDNPSR